MSKKYKLTDETIIHKGIILHRIEALCDFGNIKKGDKGGFIEKESNLSQEGKCWVYDNAKVYNDAIVGYDALVCSNAEVFDNAVICGNAIIFDNVIICNSARVDGNAEVLEYAKVFGEACIYGNAKISDRAQIFGDADVYGDAEIYGNAKVTTISDYIVFKNWWSSGRYFTWTRSNNMWSVGCFYGTGKELIAKAYKDSELSGREYKRVVDYVETILKDDE